MDKDAYNKMISDMIVQFGITYKNTNKEVFSSVNKFLQRKYKGKAFINNIRAVADDITESICIELGISY